MSKNFIRIYSDIRPCHFLDTNIFRYSFVSKSIRMSHSAPATSAGPQSSEPTWRQSVSLVSLPLQAVLSIAKSDPPPATRPKAPSRVTRTWKQLEPFWKGWLKTKATRTMKWKMFKSSVWEKFAFQIFEYQIEVLIFPGTLHQHRELYYSPENLLFRFRNVFTNPKKPSCLQTTCPSVASQLSSQTGLADEPPKPTYTFPS